MTDIDTKMLAEVMRYAGQELADTARRHHWLLKDALLVQGEDLPLTWAPMQHLTRKMAILRPELRAAWSVEPPIGGFDEALFDLAYAALFLRAIRHLGEDKVLPPTENPPDIKQENPPAPTFRAVIQAPTESPPGGLHVTLRGMEVTAGDEVSIHISQDVPTEQPEEEEASVDQFLAAFHAALEDTYSVRVGDPVTMDATGNRRRALPGDPIYGVAVSPAPTLGAVADSGLVLSSSGGLLARPWRGPLH